MRLQTALSALLLPLALIACRSAATLPAGQTIGAELTPAKTIPLHVVQQDLAAYAGQTVLVEGQATAVCQKMGCWMKVEEAGQSARVRWDNGCGGQYAFPLDVVGKRVVLQATVLEVPPSEEKLAAAKDQPDGCPKEYALSVSSLLIVDAGR